MKTIKVIPIFFALLMGITAIAQEDSQEMKTLFNNNSNGKISNGGYGSFSVGYTEINSQSSILLGGRMAWIANHHFALGLAGNGFLNNLGKEYNGYDDPSKYYLAGGYGGLLFEPIFWPNKPVHVSIPVLVGAGGISVVNEQSWKYSSNSNTYYYDTDAFFVFEPGIDIEFNIVKFFRFAIGASYRLTNGVDLRYKYLDDDYIEHVTIIDKNALDSFNVNVGFKFGWF